MNKISEFYAKAMSDESAKNELVVILGDKPFTAASDEQLIEIGKVAKKLGFDITLEEARNYLSSSEGSELSDDDLESVAGGKSRIACPGDNGGMAIGGDGDSMRDLPYLKTF